VVCLQCAAEQCGVGHLDPELRSHPEHHPWQTIPGTLSLIPVVVELADEQMAAEQCGVGHLDPELRSHPEHHP